MSFFKKKAGMATAAVIIIAAVIAVFSHFSGNNIIAGAIRTIFAPVQSGVSYISASINKQINFIREAKAYKDQNDALIDEINQLKKQNKEVSIYREENERLLALMELQNSMSNYSTVAAKVIAYSSSSRYDSIEINKGTFSGISKGNTVITDKGIVGMVEEVGPNWALVNTILMPGKATSVDVARTDVIGVIEGDAELCYDALCKLTFIDKGANIIVGDILETSGAGGIYPPGLNVGTIRDISADSMGTLNYATVEPIVDFNHLHEVLVINGVQG